MQRVGFRARIATVLFLAGVMGGCGGNHGSSSSIPSNAGATGRATLTILWPDRSRLIPFASNYIRVEVRNGSGVMVASQSHPRPVGGGTTNSAFSLLPVGNLTVQATAHPNADSSTIPQAKATAPLVIQAGQTTPFGLTMGSTINRMNLSPSSPVTLPAGQSQTFTATAIDASGNTVLTAPQTIEWTSSNTAAATVNAGQVTGVANGSTQITVRETESGKTASVTCTIQPAPVSWWQADGNALDGTGGNHGTLRNGATFGTGITGQAFLFDGVNDAISIPDAENLKITQSLTIDVWVFIAAIPTAAEFGMIVFRGDSRIGVDPYYLAVQNTGNLIFSLQDATQAGVRLSTPAPVGRWVRITATLDNATGAMRLYLDGSLAAQTTTAIRPLRNLDPGWAPGTGIGNHSGFPNSLYNYPFNGRIDEVKIYSAAVPPGG